MNNKPVTTEQLDELLKELRAIHESTKRKTKCYYTAVLLFSVLVLVLAFFV